MTDQPGDKHAQTAPSVIECHEITKSFGKNRALSDVSFQIPRGQVVGFLGPNGAGKTTTMRLIVNYLRPDRGSIRVNGFDLREHGQRLRGQIGYLPETTPLYPEMVVLDYVRMCGKLRGLRGPQLHQAIRRMVALCGLDAFLHKPISALSKGYRQRTGLAQAMIHDPDILILDEPTTGLDPNQIREILDLIRQLGASKTLLLSTHILHHVEDTCDRVLVLSRGRLEFDGTPSDLAVRDPQVRVCHLCIDQDESKMRDLLKELDFVTNWRLLKVAERRYLYALEGVESHGQMNHIHAALCRKNWNLYQLALEAPSLERAFRQLTRENESTHHQRSH